MRETHIKSTELPGGRVHVRVTRKTPEAFKERTRTVSRQQWDSELDALVERMLAE